MVTFDIAMDNSFKCIRKEKMKYHRETWWLCFFDTAKKHKASTVLITNIDETKSKFLAHDYSNAILTQSKQRHIGIPSTRDAIYTF